MLQKSVYKIKKSFRKSIFLIFYIFVACFLAVSLFSLYNLQKISIENEVKFDFENIDAILKDKIQSEAISLRLYIDNLRADKSLSEAFKNQDVGKIRKLLTPYYKKGIEDLGDLDINCVNLDDIVYLRMHSEKTGDKFDREILKITKQKAISSFYIETGNTVEADLWVSVPHYYEGKLEGYIVVGRPIFSILKELDVLSHLDFILYANKENINKKIWEVNHKNEVHEWDDMENLVYYWSSIPGFENKLDSKLFKNISKEQNQTEIFGKQYLSKSMPLINFDNSEFGKLLVLYDMSVHVKKLQTFILQLIGVSLVLILILSYFFNKIIINVERKLFESKNKIEEELRMRTRLDERLEENFNELKQLTLIASHDLRAPITNLESLLDLIEENEDDEELKKIILSNAKKSVLNMKATMDSLTEIMHQRESLKNKVIQEVNIEKVFETVISQIDTIITNKNIEMKSDFSKVKLFEIDELHLKSILLNLFSNSIKYSTEQDSRKSFIEISTFVEKDKKGFLIKDNGIGFDVKKQKDNLFKPFKRFHHHKKGDGVGLYLTKMIVDSYEGDIKIESEVGLGTTVKITF